MLPLDTDALNMHHHMHENYHQSRRWARGEGLGAKNLHGRGLGWIDVLEYFKDLAEETGIPFQNLINLYLRDCVVSRKRPSLSWAS